MPPGARLTFECACVASACASASEPHEMADDVLDLAVKRDAIPEKIQDRIRAELCEAENQHPRSDEQDAQHLGVMQKPRGKRPQFALAVLRPALRVTRQTRIFGMMNLREKWPPRPRVELPFELFQEVWHDSVRPIGRPGHSLEHGAAKTQHSTSV